MPLFVRRGNVAVNPVPSAVASIVKVPSPIGAPALRAGACSAWYSASLL